MLLILIDNKSSLYIALFDTSGILTAPCIVIKYIQINYVHMCLYMNIHEHLDINSSTHIYTQLSIYTSIVTRISIPILKLQ